MFRERLAFARVYKGLGEKDLAFQWTKKSYEEHGFGQSNIKVWPLWDSIRDDPRFQDLLRRMNFPE